MNVNITVDTSGLTEGIRQLSKGSKKLFAKKMNQAMYDVVYESFVNMPPGPGIPAIDAERARIRAYLGRQIGEAHNRLKSGKLGRRKKRSRQLKARHLIMQAIYKKKGWKGLYGKQMAKVAAAFSRGKGAGAGYLQAPLSALISKWAKVPGIYRQKFSTYMNRIWLGGKFHPAGIHTQFTIPAIETENPEATSGFEMKIADNQIAKVDAMYQRAISTAIATKMRRITQDIEKDTERMINDLTRTDY